MTAVGDLSAHFSQVEFRDRRTGHDYGPPDRLLSVLELLRSVVGRPLRIVSGHRCCSSNATVRGASESRHIAGDAVDIPSGYCTVRQAADAGSVGIGERAGWAVHIDVRPGQSARWSY